jgi:hypothetical protein
MKWLMSLIVGTCLYLPTLSHTQVIQHQISDDGYVRVPLQFAFPYYGRVFTESYMFSNGVVGFLNPTNTWCCTGFDLRTNNGTPFSFAIMPLQTDLLNYGGRFLTEGTPQYQRYVWENISEFGVPHNLNTFGVEIRPTGFIGMHYEQVNISPSRPVTIGMTGDVGEFSQFYHGAGFSQGNFSHIIESTGNLCVTNPLSSPSCSGYQEAYLAQQCSVSSLYSPQCPNYQQAYQDYQCSLNALYSTSCQGYGEAYTLANIVNPSRPVSIPQVQVSTRGTVSVETPIVSDTVVNEVITREPTSRESNQPSNQNSVAQTQQVQSPQTEKPKETVKSETKPKQQVKVGSIEVPTIATPVIKAEQVQIVDLLSRKMISKPIKNSDRDFYLMMVGTHKLHEDMIDGQYRKGN